MAESIRASPTVVYSAPIALGLNAETSKLSTLIEKTQKVLLKISSIFPFDLFPDTVEIDENKVTVVTRTFFYTAEVHSVLIENISRVSLNTFLWFGSLEIVDSTNPRFPIEIRIDRLKSHEAKEAQHLLQGLITAKDQVDLTQFKAEHLEHQMATLGKARDID